MEVVLVWGGNLRTIDISDFELCASDGTTPQLVKQVEERLLMTFAKSQRMVVSIWAVQLLSREHVQTRSGTALRPWIETSYRSGSKSGLGL